MLRFGFRNEDRYLSVFELRGDRTDRVVGAYEGIDRELLVTWAGTQCPESGDLFIGPGVDEIVIAPRIGPECLKGSSVRGVVLEFKLEVDLAAVGFDIRPRPNT